ncbi:Bax inhibitor-1/YccA family protein [Sulfurovum sp.]|jgi:modulator of FtsH protease|uniref:Bax inhibitor-1/YccA family protein n=1 Tax=Sulfurovum sp. TaxID=1969726 RepID=UPI002A3630DE|nr:Bax inhibitor-1/YccA family protein [Sulfurovum sp.]MDD2451833.1 Bax inhibitor-1/YccA family protein [Sulfurovum sp.]MDD3500348.1 Bax inhibitor-1/YccA family protein [Sulfurovum sp.]MDY0402886.1 Bax inhibitor-1/YccA family protein [Sulfurovum sp.]
MALYNRNYSNTAETGYVQEGASVGFMKQTYQLLAASMIAAAVGAYLTMPYAHVVMQYKWFIFGFELFMLFIGLGMTRNKPGLNLAALFVFTFATGVSLVPLLASLIGAGNGAVIGNAFLMTSVLFGALSLFAINSKKDYASWGKPLFITLIVVVVGSLVNYFLLQSPIMHIIITAGILLLFSLFTIYDTQNIANGAYDSPVDAAVSLYLDFLNIFTALLQLLGIFGNDD